MGHSRLGDRRILITGAASGIGRQLAEDLAREGARLHLVDIDGARLGALGSTLAATAPGRITLHELDVAAARGLDGHPYSRPFR